jgi:hypothetical protein
MIKAFNTLGFNNPITSTLSISDGNSIPSPAEKTISNRTIQTLVFSANGTWVMPRNVVNAEVLVIGGGGGGGNASGFEAGGGGGAGQLIYYPSYKFIGKQNYAMTIGAGGNASSNGSSTTFGSLFTAIGGGGGNASSNNGYNGGGGGGGSLLSAGTGNGGFNGGTGNGDGTYRCGGGGGGYAEAGVNVSTPNAGSSRGGNGYTSSITGTSINYAVGGSGGGYNIGGTNSQAGGGQQEAQLSFNAYSFGSGGSGCSNQAGVGTAGGKGCGGAVIMRYYV